MNFAKFPFDVQKCFINLTMTNEGEDLVRLVWKDFRIGSRVDTTEFEIVNTSRSENCTKDYEDIWMSLSCLYASIVFRRNIGNYLIRRFIPSFMIVILNFLGFWIPTTVSPARVSLSVTALLALITQQIQSELNVSYVYSLQVWNTVCIIFVFASLCEFALALFNLHMVQKRKAKVFKRMYSTSPLSPIPKAAKPADSENPFFPPQNSSPNSRFWRRFKSKLAKHFQTTTRHSSVDYAARYLFPITYLIFVAFFAIHSTNESRNSAFYL